SDYYGTQVIDASTQNRPWLTTAQQGLSYTHDLATGNIAFRFAPWGLIKSARGPAIPFALQWTSSFQLMQGNTAPGELFYWYYQPTPGSGLNETTPKWTPSSAVYFGSEAGQDNVECDQWGPFIFTDFDGVAHDLGLLQISDSIGQTPSSVCPAPEVDAATAEDDPAIYTAFDANGGITQISKGDGTRYFFGPVDGYGDYLVNKIEDANGNYVTISYPPSGQAGNEVWTDAAGNVVLDVLYDSSGSISAVETFDSSGAPMVYTLNYSQQTFPAINLANPDNSTCDGAPYCEVDTQVSPGGTGVAFSGITLPDGSAYTLSSPAGDQVITYPAGGSVRFHYADLRNMYNCPAASGSMGCDLWGVTDEWRSDGITTGHYQYTYTPGTFNSLTLNVTDPAGQVSTYSFAPLGGCSYVEVQRVEADAAGTFAGRCRRRRTRGSG